MKKQRKEGDEHCFFCVSHGENANSGGNIFGKTGKKGRETGRTMFSLNPSKAEVRR